MINELYENIISNPKIIETLFHLETYDIETINPTKRIITKYYSFEKIYKCIPIIKELFKEDENKLISFKITEIFENNEILYEVKLKENPILNNNHYFYDFSSLVRFICNDNKIDIILKNNKTDINEQNPINLLIINIIISYLDNDNIMFIKNNILEKELKPLLYSINPHSFVLNII